ncbi:regulator of Ty1 transposition protein 105 [Monosporozyma servazzii]
MSSSLNHFDIRTGPTTKDDDLPMGVSPTTPSKPTKYTNIGHISSSGSGDVVSSIISERSSRSGKYADNPHNIGSSPLTPKDRCELRIKEQQKRSKNQRFDQKERKSLKNRGGLERMEDFIMKGEREREIDEMSRLAQENEIPDDLVDKFENNIKTGENWDYSSEEDDDLIQYFEDKEKYEKELEQLLSELSVS